MYPALNAVLLLAGLLLPVVSGTAAAASGSDAVVPLVESFLKAQSTGLDGDVTITVGGVDSRITLAPCPSPQTFLPTGARPIGHTTVGVRCPGPTPWTVYVPATVKVMGNYVAAATALSLGQHIGADDLVRRAGDLAQMPPGVISDPALAVGRILTASIAAGMPLRHEWLKEQTVVQAGQAVRLTVSGSGFSVTTEGTAVGAASEGQPVQARTSSGATVSGIAHRGAVVEVKP